MNELFLKIINMSIAASWLVLAVLVLRLVLKKASKWVNVLLWGTVAVRLIFPFSFESALSLIPSSETIPLNIEMDTTPAIDSGITAINNVVNPIISQSNTPADGAGINPLQITVGIFESIWILGIVVLLIYTAISYWRLHQKVYTAVRCKDNIFQSENVSSPFAFGEAGVKERVKSVMNYKKPAFWILILAVIACIIVAVCFLTNPVTIGDYFVLTDSGSPADTNKLTYDVQLGSQTMSGEIYVEQWIDGTCVRSAPVVMTQYVESIEISMRERREDGASAGTDIQIETNQHGGSLLTYFPHPENLNIIGWAFKGCKLGEKNKLSPNKEVILAAKVFDNGSGVRVFDCETLTSEPERLENAAYMIVVRAVFSADPLGVTSQEEAPIGAFRRKADYSNGKYSNSKYKYGYIWIAKLRKIEDFRLF